METELLAAIDRAHLPSAALGAAPMPRLDGLRWTDVAHLLRSRIDGSACGDALAWAGDALLGLLGEGRRPARRRPWSASFDRSQSCVSRERTGRAVVADWIADEIWSLEWTTRGSFAVALAELATRALVAEDVAATIERAGARPDRAAAEAVLVAELTGASSLWRGIVAHIHE